MDCGGLGLAVKTGGGGGAGVAVLWMSVGCLSHCSQWQRLGYTPLPALTGLTCSQMSECALQGRGFRIAKWYASVVRCNARRGWEGRWAGGLKEVSIKINHCRCPLRIARLQDGGRSG